MTKNESTLDINKVSVEVDGVRYEGWKSARIEVGIDQICRAFVLSVTDDFPGNQNFSRLQPGQEVILRIGEDRVCTGYTTSTPISYDARTVSVQVQGKSKTVDLVDCCSPWSAIASAPSASSDSADQWSDVKTGAPKTQVVKPAKTTNTSWHNQTAVQIISDLCSPYGIKVICEVSSFNTKLTNFTVNPGEKVFESINRLLTKENLVVTDNEFGDLVITEAGKNGTSPDRLETGKNILSSSSNFDVSKVFSVYAVLGQHKGTDLEFGRQTSQDKGIAYDKTVRRYRLLVIKDSGQSSGSLAANRAQFERLFRLANSQTLTLKIQGWRQSNDNLWKVNMIVPVLDSIVGVSGSRLVKRLTMNLDSSGTTSQLELILPSAYERKGARQQQVTKKSEADPWPVV